MRWVRQGVSHLLSEAAPRQDSRGTIIKRTHTMGAACSARHTGVHSIYSEHILVRENTFFMRFRRHRHACSALHTGYCRFKSKVHGVCMHACTPVSLVCTYACVYVCVCACVFMCVCLCMCVVDGAHTYIHKIQTTYNMRASPRARLSVKKKGRSAGHAFGRLFTRSVRSRTCAHVTGVRRASGTATIAHVRYPKTWKPSP